MVLQLFAGKIAGAPGHAAQRQHEHGKDHSHKRFLKGHSHGEARAHGQNVEAEPCQIFENEIVTVQLNLMT